MDIEKYHAQIEDIVQNALDEDLNDGDITTEILLPYRIQGSAALICKAKGILAGIDVSSLVFHKVDPLLKFNKLVSDGCEINPGDILAVVEGDIRSILKAERTALNFLQHLSGIATLTSQYVNAIKDLPVKILDTRKTIPGLRILEKYAVSAGGGTNHRLNLGDLILIKDNHIAAMRLSGYSIQDILHMARDKCPHGMLIEIEASSIQDALAASNAGADIVMLDNMKLDDMRQAVKLINRRCIIEASGGVNLDTVRKIAETGVDWISVGSITHSSSSIDISLKLL